NEKKEEVRANMAVALVDSLRQQLSMSESDLNAAKEQIERLKTEQAELASTRAEYLTLKDEIEIYRELLNTVQKQLDTIQGNNLINANQILWMQQPFPPDSRSFPKLAITLSVAVALGLFLSLGIAFLREMLDTTV